MEIRLLRLPALVALLLIALTTAAAAPATASSPPALTPRQVRAAVRKAERSKDLWATVNICNTKSHPNTIGIRGQMPSLGFAAKLTMQFRVQYWSGKAFTPVRGLSKTISLGPVTRGLYQAGVGFPFAPHAGLLRGSVTLEWRLRGRRVGQVTVATRTGHPDADFGDPKGFSAGLCGIP
jgi:hypothetical protein